ncbi:hypothetical protein V5R04_10530 [Jonesiaceae bacterium BS-20]|uniref:Uncharacterized protein n=1 Tax=Jonesiaceae bacterium BS-20 TaxID=3120821 RepID=A0AAU7DTN7_9MICO
MPTKYKTITTALVAALAAMTAPVAACSSQPSAEFTAAATRAISAGEPPPQHPSAQGPLDQGPLDQLDTIELQAAIAGLQLLLDQEYRATVELDSELMMPVHTDGWSFGNHDYGYLENLRSNGTTVIGHTPAQILSVLEATSPEPGRWLITALTSELSMEILTADGVHLLDTRGKGSLMATYEILRS